MSQHVVIAGGGFGGYYTAKTLERRDAEGRPDHACQRRQLHAVRAAAAGRRRGHARAAPRRDPAARAAQADRAATRVGDRWRPGSECAAGRPARRQHGRLPLRPAGRRARVGVAHVPDPGAGRARDRVQDDRRGDRATQPASCVTSRRPRRSTTRRSAASYLELRVRRRRLRRARGHRRAAGLRRGRDQATTRAAARPGCAGC